MKKKSNKHTLKKETTQQSNLKVRRILFKQRVLIPPDMTEPKNDYVDVSRPNLLISLSEQGDVLLSTPSTADKIVYVVDRSLIKQIIFDIVAPALEPKPATVKEPEETPAKEDDNETK